LSWNCPLKPKKLLDTNEVMSTWRILAEWPGFPIPPDKRSLNQPDRVGWFLDMKFPEAVRGPLVLGIACRFGFGLLAPAGAYNLLHV
jgi:hypothetical protein